MLPDLTHLENDPTDAGPERGEPALVTADPLREDADHVPGLQGLVQLRHGIRVVHLACVVRAALYGNGADVPHPPPAVFFSLLLIFKKK